MPIAEQAFAKGVARIQTQDEAIMRFATGNEIEYLGAIEGITAADSSVICEMRQRLDALRRFDQNFSDDDWSPHGNSSGWRVDSPTRPS
jgi:hypothetical protein